MNSISQTKNGLKYRLVQEGSETSLFVYPQSNMALEAFAGSISELRLNFGVYVPIKVSSLNELEIDFKRSLALEGYKGFTKNGKKPMLFVHADIVGLSNDELQEHISFLRELAEQLQVIRKNKAGITETLMQGEPVFSASN